MSLSLRGKRHGPEKRKRGWTAPGYNYLGPGNDMGDLVPVDEDDAIAQEHDENYRKYQKYEMDPYWNYNPADEKARTEFGHGYGGWIGKAAFTAKKAAAKVGLIGELPPLPPDEPGDWTEEVDGEGQSHISPKQHKHTKRFAGTMSLRGSWHDRFMQSAERAAAKKKLDAFKKPMNNDDKKNTSDPADAPVVNDPMNGTTSRAGQAAGATGKYGSHSETGIDAWKNAKLRPFPMTQNAIIPYYVTTSGLLTSVQTEGGQYNFTIRLNSIWDCLTQRTHSEDPTVVADSADGTIQTPIMRQYWIQLYQYWTVVSCHYKVRFWTEDRGHQELEIFEYKHGMQTPPVVNGSGTSGGLLWRKHRMMHPRMRYKTMNLRPTAMTEKDPYERQIIFEGDWNFGETYNHVAEDELAQTWHKEAECPPMREQVTFLVQRSERSPFGTNVTIKYDVELVYHVQWKDLKAKMEYPYPDADITFTNYPVQGN